MVLVPPNFISPPSSSCAYLARHFTNEQGSNTETELDDDELLKPCICICDDDNDLEMAAACGKVFLPTVTSESMQQAVAQSEKIFVMENKEEGIIETKSTENALVHALMEFEKRGDRANS